MADKTSVEKYIQHRRDSLQAREQLQQLQNFQRQLSGQSGSGLEDVNQDPDEDYDKDGDNNNKTEEEQLLPADSPAAGENGIDSNKLKLDIPQRLPNLGREDSTASWSRFDNGTPSTGTPKSPAERVRVILSDSEPNSEIEVDIDAVDKYVKGRPIFCQMDVLCHFDDGQTGWKEAARWLKYEEKVESGDRWSKPHVPTVSLHSLFEIRKHFAQDDSVILLDVDSKDECIHQLTDSIKQGIMQNVPGMTDEVASKIREILLKPHKHKHRKGGKKSHQTLSHNETVISLQSMEDGENGDIGANNNNSALNGGSKKKGLGHTFQKLKQRNMTEPTDLVELYDTYPGDVKPDHLNKYKPNKRLMKKIPNESEAANILIGQVDFLKAPIVIFTRVSNPSVMGDLCEVSIPTKFLFIVLGPKASEQSVWEYGEMGRAMATMFTDKVFCEVAYKATDKQDIIAGMDEFIDDLTVLPPSIWDPSTRLDPPQKTMSMAGIRKRLVDKTRHGPNEEGAMDFHDGDATLQRTGRLFGGLIQDIKRKSKFYISDLRDGLHLQCAASVFFLYFACITPIITFGLMLGDATDGYMGTMECLVSGTICGLIYHIFSGQPLTIMGATGPLLVFEGILYGLCRDYGFHFMSFRMYIGLWIALICFIFVMFDLSALVRYITRFTEESFSVLISLIFIFEAFKKLLSITKYYPLGIKAAVREPDYRCYCEKPHNETVAQVFQPDYEPQVSYNVLNEDMYSNTTNVTQPKMEIDGYNWTYALPEFCRTFTDRVWVDHDCISEADCHSHGWNIEGDACNVKTVTHAVPDVFLFSCIMFFFTFKVALFLKKYRNSPYFPSIVRGTISDFAVTISILLCTGIDFALRLDTPKLSVPEKFSTTRPDRGWYVNPMDITYWWLIPLAIIPAILGFILIFLDQQITAVIVNRKEHKLKKSHGYHLDLFILAILIVICSCLGLPWFVAATVRSITHVRSLFAMSEQTAPGERPQFLGVREQRVTGICIHLLIGVSVLMTPILKYVPMAVLYGVFLYMGYTSLKSVQFVDRLRILFMPSKNQPDFVFLRHVDIKRVHIFTMIQVICMAIMWVLKSIKAVSISFPLMILGLCFVRYFMEYFFTKSELYWLDHLLPETEVRKKDDDMKDDIDVDMKESEIDSDEKTDADKNWDKMVAARDQNQGRAERRLSMGIIERHRKSQPDVKLEDETNHEPRVKFE